MTTPFWSNEPTILINGDSILQVWPQSSMAFEAKLNAISRMVILLSILGFVFTVKHHFIVIGLITLAIIFSFYKYRKQTIVKKLTEGFSGRSNNRIDNNKDNNEDDNNKDDDNQDDDNQYYNNQEKSRNSVKNGSNQMNKNKNGRRITSSTFTTNPITLESVLRSDFHPTTKKNPFGNVLLTDIMDDPDRKAAAPSFNPDVSEDITTAVKKQTQMLYPSIDSTNKQLYGDLKDNYDLDKSMMRFYSTANTRIDSDQGAFANWLYSEMPSGKSSGPDGAFARVQDNYRYILI